MSLTSVNAETTAFLSKLNEVLQLDSKPSTNIIVNDH